MIAPLYPTPGSSEPDAFTRLIGEAFVELDKRREQKALSTRRPGVGAASHKREQESATLSDGIMDRELGQVPSAVSKAAGARKGLGCKSSAIRSQRRRRRAS